jgi:hypothetical protein
MLARASIRRRDIVRKMEGVLPRLVTEQFEAKPVSIGIRTPNTNDRMTGLRKQ